MFHISARWREKSARTLIMATSTLLFPQLSFAQDTADAVFASRVHNPFTQIYGLPPFQTATLATKGETDYGVSFELANNADAGDNETENFVSDGESYSINLSIRHRARNWLELGVDVPLVAHEGGFMDGLIKNWHDIIGASNMKRRGPDDQLQFLYQSNGNTLYELTSSSSGIGDVQLSAAVRQTSLQVCTRRTYGRCLVEPSECLALPARCCWATETYCRHCNVTSYRSPVFLYRGGLTNGWPYQFRCRHKVPITIATSKRSVATRHSSTLV